MTLLTRSFNNDGLSELIKAKRRKDAFDTSMHIRRLYQIRYFARGWTIPSKRAVQPEHSYNAHCTVYYKILLLKIKRGEVVLR